MVQKKGVCTVNFGQWFPTHAVRVLELVSAGRHRETGNGKRAGNVAAGDELEIKQRGDVRSLDRIGLQHRADHFGRGRPQGRRDTIVALADLCVRILQTLGLERWLANEQRVHDATDRPNVDLVAVALLVQNLRRDVVRRSAQRLLAFPFVLNFGGQPKVTDLDVQLVVQEQIAQLQISVDDVLIVQILDSRQHLVDVVPALVIGDDLTALVQLHHRLSGGKKPNKN